MNLDKELADELIEVVRQYQAESEQQYLAVVRRVSQLRSMVKGESCPADWWDATRWQWRRAEESSDYDKNSGPRFKYPISVLQAAWLILQGAIQTVGIPGSTFRPQNSRHQQDVEAAKSATEIITYQRTVVDFRDLLMGIFRLFFTDGICVAYTRHVVDPDQFGTSVITEPIREPQETRPAGYQCFNEECNEFIPQGQTMRDELGMIHCPTCGYELHEENFMPPQIEDVVVREDEKEVPNGREVTDLYGALETFLPYWANDLDHAPYCAIITEVPKEEVIGAFPDKEADILSQSSESGRPQEQARRQARSPMNSPLGGDNNLVTYARWWLRPKSLNRVVDIEKRKKLQKLFPKGVFFQLCGIGEPIFLDARQEKMTDKLTLMRPFKGDGMYTPSIGQAGVPIELSVTDAWNMGLEGMLFAGFPEIILDGEVHSGAAVSNSRINPGSYRVVQLQGGKKLGDSFAEIKATDISQSVQSFLESAIPWLEFLLGTERVLQGGPITNVRTSSGQSQARSQALQRQAPAYGAVKNGLAGIQERMVNEFVQNRPPETYFEVTSDNGDYEQRKIQLNPDRGRVIAFPEVSESIPQTWAQKQDVISSWIESQNPAIQAALAYPKNLRLVYDSVGMLEFTVPGKELADKYERLIGTLLEGQLEIEMMADELDPAAGQVPVANPSIKFDPVLDDAEIALAVIREWAATPEGMAIAASDSPGYQNLRKYAEQAWTARNMAMAPQQQPQEQAA